MHFLQTINSDISVLIACNKTGGTIKGDIKKNILPHCIYVFCVDLRTNSDYFPIQH